MPLNNNIHPQFHSGDKVISLKFHPPEIKSGAWATIVSARVGKLYVVLLPNGDPYKWMADFELQSVDLKNNKNLKVGDLVKVISDEGHTPEVTKGMIVKIVKVTAPTPFYDAMIRDAFYHRWFVESEIIPF